eukprot:143490-Hanusia_phi.AAC.2
MTDDDVNRAYRKLTRYCHPDKLSGMPAEDAEKAEKAYEKLRIAKECLTNEDSRGPYVREHVKCVKMEKNEDAIKGQDVVGTAEKYRARDSPLRRDDCLQGKRMGPPATQGDRPDPREGSQGHGTECSP